MNESEIFNAAVKLSAEERAKFLDLVCKNNPALRGQVDGLLKAHFDSQSFLADSEEVGARRRRDAEGENQPPEFPRPGFQRSPADAPQFPRPGFRGEGRVRGLRVEYDETSASPTETAGTIIAGKYKLLDKPIGEGGMGTVWMAEQRAPVKRLVAVKLIKAGMDSKAVLARFEAERHALALMDHPNIARILDGGMTEAGSPFFVMELVKGVPITEFCDARKLTPKERLELFVPVCQAIQHAHQKGIIHRDIKPSNVLVALYDDRPVPKVIDFGVAKATGQALTEQTLNTGFSVVGTPQYMSPEQATFNQMDIDTRSDIYSLGVLLYELLAGSPPFKKQELEKAGLLEMLRVIREEEPPRPSTKASTADGLPSISANRGIEPSKLCGLLRNELDWIVMKALEKDRARRYETANGFAADINRYLAGEAVLAHPPSKAYRLKKFLRKNKGPVLAASLIFVALLAGVIGTTLGLFEARAQRKVADRQRDRAVEAEQSAKARADELKMVSDFQAGMLAQVDPTAAGLLLTADVNAKFAEALAKANVSESERAPQISAFAQQWRRVNATDAARELIDRTILQPAVKTIDTQFADQPVVDAQLRQTLATRYRDLGLYDAAMPLQMHALATRRRVLGEEHSDTLNSINNMGSLLQAQGKLTEAEPYFHQLLTTRRRVLGEEHAGTLTAINNMGSLLQAQGKMSEAEPYFRDGLEKRRHVLGEEHSDTLNSINNMGILLQAQGKLSEAEPYFRDGLEKRRHVLGEEHSDTLNSINNMGILLQAQDKLIEAEPYFREALEKRRRVLGEDHPDTLAAINNMGGVLSQQGKLSEAEPYYRDALEKGRRVLGDKHPLTLNSINNLGMLLMARGKLTEAEPYLREAVENKKIAQGKDHPDTLNLINNLGGLLQAQDKLDEAEPYFREAVDGGRRVLGPMHPSTLGFVINLGKLLQAQGKHADTIELLAPIQAASRNALSGGNAWRVARLLSNLGTARAGLGEFAAAEANLIDAQSIFVQTRGPANKETHECTQALIALYTAWHAAEPDKGYDAKAAEWKAKLDEFKAETTSEIPPSADKAKRP